MNYPLRESKNLLLKMSTFDAVMTRKSVFHGETNEIAVLAKMLEFFVV